MGRKLLSISSLPALLASFLIPLTIQGQIVFADYSDPDVCEGSEGDYWMTASSFQCTPGLPILHSTDLVNWQLVNHAVERLLPLEHYNAVRHGQGVWAPSIRRHNNTYYIYWGDPDYGIWMVKTDNPRGRWSEPTLVVEGKGLIDPCPLWDEDGRCYLVNAWAASRCGFNSVLTVRELSPDGSRAIGEPVLVYDGQTEGNHTIEGPKLYKRDGYFYILAPAGGVEKGWQVALRSCNGFGPYDSKIVFNQDGIHQGGWVADKFVAFQDRGAYGRILHLLDVTWKEGWPMMKSAQIKPMPLTANDIRLFYQWHANYQESFGFHTSKGVRVYGHNVSKENVNLWQVPNLYLRKFWGESFCDTLHLTITAKEIGQQSGFVVMGRNYLRMSLEFTGNDFVLKRIICRDADQGGREEETLIATIPAHRYEAGALPNYECSVAIRLQCERGAVCRLAYSTDAIHYLDIPGSFPAREGKWIGAKYGVYSLCPNTSSKGWVDLVFK